MATTQTVLGINQLRGPSGPKGELRTFEVPVRVSGTYLTGGKPNFSLLAALQANAHMAVTAVDVKRAWLARDYYDGTNRYTAPNAQIALSGTNNTTVTWRVDSGATNGATGSEIADSTALDGIFTIGVEAAITAE